MGFLADFKKFAMKGNFVDLAVAVIIAGAFGTVTTSLVGDVLMPPLGLLLNNVDFKDLYLPLDGAWLDQAMADGGSMPPLAEAQAAGVATLRYGMFINTLINFVFVAFAVFLLVKVLTNLQKKEPPPPPPGPTASETLLAEIRDLLKAKRPA
jgi:large conductance mechanosensitive channel